MEKPVMIVYSILVFVALGPTPAPAEPNTLGNEPVLPSAIDVADINDANYASYILYLKQNAKPPIEYVVDKFKDHDVVILGESHQVKENCQLIRDLIEPLYHKAGVTVFAMEFLKSKNIALVNQLVTGKDYDQRLAVRIFRDCAWPTWGFKEYMDIVKVIWQVNSKLPPQAKPMRVVALETDWDAYDLVSGVWSDTDEEKRDYHMANILAREVLDRKGEKALVQIGYNHTFTRYRMPSVKDGRFAGQRHPAFGYILYEKYGDKIFQICLHLRHASPMMLKSSKPQPDPILSDFIEQVLRRAGNKPAGFDIRNSPFARLRDKGSHYFAFQKNVVFSDIAQGYIYIKPIKKLGKMTWVKGFIDHSNFEKAKAIAEKSGWIKKFEEDGRIRAGECDTPEGLDRLLKMLFEAE